MTAGNAARRILKNAVVPAAALEAGAAGGPLLGVDIVIADGRVVEVLPAGSPPADGDVVHDMQGGLVLPAFADIHTHLDKGHIWPRQPNPDGTWMGALLTVLQDQNKWSSLDVERRMDFSLRCAYAHGTAAIRTHLDSSPPQHDISWDLFEQMRERWAGRIELQAVALISPDNMLNAGDLDLVARRTQAARGILGGAILSHPDSKRAMLAVVDKAGELGLDLDMHVDETLDPASSCLLHLAEAVIETGYTGKVLAGHCCVLAVQDEATQRHTIETVARAGVAIVSLPMCNLYLQDRDAAAASTPMQRGVTLVKELAAVGVPVAIASDNTRDPFYAYGDLDALEVFRAGARILHFDHPQATAWDWLRMVTWGAADIAGFAHQARIAVGAPADLVLCRARNWTELLARPQSDRMVLRAGKPIDTTLPDYRELDDLMET